MEKENIEITRARVREGVLLEETKGREPYFHETIFYRVAIGDKLEKISEDLNYSVGTIQNIIKKEPSKKKIQEIRWKIFGADAKTKFKNLVPKAYAVIEEILDNDTLRPETRLTAAKEVLDRAMGKALQQIDVGGTLVGDLVKMLDDQKKGILAVNATAVPINKSEIPEADFREVETIAVQQNKAPQKTQEEIDKWIKENL